MAAIGTGNYAAAAANALGCVKAWINHRCAVKVMREVELGQKFSYKVFQFGYAPFGHIILQTQNHVINDAVSVLHYCCADLHVVTAQLDEFQSVTPGLDAAYAAELDILEDGVLCHCQDVPKGDRLHSVAGVSGTSLASVNL